MKRLRGERGYTLFLTVLTIFLFSIMAMSLLTITISGAKRSAVREDVTQAGELAEKALKHLTQQINYEVQVKIDGYKDGATIEEYHRVMYDVLDKYKCQGNGSLITANTGKYNACVQNYVKKEDEIEEDKDTNRAQQKVQIKTIGESEGKEKNLYATVIFEGNAIPNDMKYAVNTFMNGHCGENLDNCKPGEGNLFLHGGSMIRGDINVDRNLITSNRSHEEYEIRSHWIHSYYPLVRPIDEKNGEIPRIIVGNDVYTVSWDSNKYNGTKIDNFNYDRHISLIDNFPTKAPYNKKETIDENVFTGNYVPVVSDRTDHPGRNEIRIRDKLNEVEPKYKYYHDDDGVKHVQTKIIGGDVAGARRILRNAQFPNDRVFPKIDNNFHSNFIINGNSTFKQFATYEDLALGQIRNDNVIEFKEGLYVGGNLRIHSNTQVKGPIFVNGDFIIDGSHNIIIDSPVYVRGRVHIRGPKNITLNSVFYVNESFYLRHADPKGDATLEQEIKGEHIVYANSHIRFKRVNRFNDYPQDLYGYYYSNESIEMDGNESNLRVYGGLSAPRIVLNSIRGQSSTLPHRLKRAGRQLSFGEPLLRYFDSTDEQKRKRSRLEVVYDKHVFDKHAGLLLESKVTGMLTPEMIDLTDKER